MVLASKPIFSGGISASRFPACYIFFLTNYVYVPGDLYYQFIASSTDDLALVMNRFAVGVSNILPEILRGASLTLSMMMFVATLLKMYNLLKYVEFTPPFRMEMIPRKFSRI